MDIIKLSLFDFVIKHKNIMTKSSLPLSTPQLELLQMFARPVDEKVWQNIKIMITQYFAQKAIEEADKISDNENWDEEKVNNLLNSHLSF